MARSFRIVTISVATAALTTAAVVVNACDNQSFGARAGRHPTASPLTAGGTSAAPVAAVGADRRCTRDAPARVTLHTVVFGADDLPAITPSSSTCSSAAARW